MRPLEEIRVVAINFLWLSIFVELLFLIYNRWVYVLRPTDGCCFCLRAPLRKPQQTDGRYRDLLITDTLTFKAVFLSLSVERNESYTTSCQPHIIMASKRLLRKQHTISRAKNVGQLKDRNLEKTLCESPQLFFSSLKARLTSMESYLHFLLIKIIFWQLSF